MADHTALPAQLVRYWVHGEGAGKIGWNSPGDFERCKVAIQVAVVKDGKALSDRVLSGLCSNLHTVATGGRPGHGSAEAH